jgi:hypothetical protein
MSMRVATEMAATGTTEGLGVGAGTKIRGVWIFVLRPPMMSAVAEDRCDRTAPIGFEAP